MHERVTHEVQGAPKNGRALTRKCGFKLGYCAPGGALYKCRNPNTPNPNRHLRRLRCIVENDQAYSLKSEEGATIACISNASAYAALAFYFGLILHALRIGSIVNSSAEYELS